MEIVPTFYTKEGAALVGDAFRMEAAEVKTIDLKSLMPEIARHRHDLGGMTLSYSGHPLEMWGQLRLLHVARGNSVDVLFANLSDNRSNVRNAVWAKPKQGEAIIAIGNATDVTANTTLQFSNGDSMQVEIRPFGTELIRRRSEANGGAAAAAEGVTITSPDGRNLFFAGAVISDDGSFTSSIRFYDTVNVLQQDLFATNFRLDQVKPLMLLRNTGSESIVATPRFRPVKGDGTTFIDLPGMTLGPNEIASVDFAPLIAATRGQPDFNNVSIDVLNTGAKGSLVGALNGSDEVTGITYDVPLRDIGGLRFSTGAYPWRLDGDVSTTASITNVAPVSSEFVVQINYPGGPYLLNPRTLAAGATATFDLRTIRDRQVPDRNGHTIPLSVSGGQFRWFIHGAGSGRLIGRVEMLSRSRGISSSYSCNDPCPPQFGSIIFEPDGMDVLVGETLGQGVAEIDYDSNGNQYGPFSPYVAEWYSTDTNIASLEPEGTYADITGVAPGFASSSVGVFYERYVWDGLNCYDFGQNEATQESPVVVGEIRVGTVSISPTSINGSHGATVSVTLSTSSDVTSTAGTTLALQEADADGSFQLGYNPVTTPVNMQGGQTNTFNIEVTLTSGSGHCAFVAHVTSTLTVNDNDMKKSARVPIG